MLKEAHVHARFTLQIDGDHITKEDIKKAFDDKATDMLNGGRILTLSGEATLVVDEKEIYNTEEKCLIVNMCVREGCRTYDIKKVVTVPTDMSQADIEEKVIFESYGEVTGTIDDEGSSYKDNSGYYYDNGEYAVVCDSFNEITKAEFETLKKFL
jgi:hypothetical protein